MSIWHDVCFHDIQYFNSVLSFKYVLSKNKNKT